MNPHPVYLKAKAGQWLNVTDTAALCRTALKRAFPAVKFSVRSSSYSGGSSVHVSWTDGPTSKEVDRVIKPFETKDFDGSIDLAHDSDIWLAPDGSACCAYASGTQGSGGCDPERIGSAHHPDAILVDRISSSYVMSQRTISAELWLSTAREVLLGWMWSASPSFGANKFSLCESRVEEILAKCINSRGQLDPYIPHLYCGDRGAHEMINIKLSDTNATPIAA